MSIIQDINEKIAALFEQKKEIQKQCNHPEIARTYTFHQSTDEYGRGDGPGHYSVTCGMCELYFHTDKKGGMPE